MNYSFVFLAEAQDEYESSLLYYLERSAKSSENFVSAIDDCINLICSNPYQWRNEYKDFYELTVKKFPFSIIYRVNKSQKTVLITSVFHHSRNPKKKY
jgi:plasmid stabilization system protein ParE